MLLHYTLLILFGISYAVTPLHVSRTLAKVPIISAAFDILDFDIQFECPVVISTSCSSRDVLDDSFRHMAGYLHPKERKEDVYWGPPTKDGLAATAWVTVGGHVSFASVLSHAACTDTLRTVCIGPSSDLATEHKHFFLNKRGIFAGDSDATVARSRGMRYVGAIKSSNGGWSFQAERVMFGEKSLELVNIAINTDQVAPISISDKNFEKLFGEEIISPPSAFESRIRLIKPSCADRHQKKDFTIIANPKFAMYHRNMLNHDKSGLWIEIISDPKDVRYEQIGIGYDLLESLHIHFDNEKMRIGFKVSI